MGPPAHPRTDPAGDDRRAANHARAAAVAELLTDVGMVVLVVQERLATDDDGELRGWTDDPYATQNRVDDDLPLTPTGVVVTIVEERRAGEAPFDGVHVQWCIHPRVRKAGADALAELMALGAGLPDPLPEVMVRNGRWHATMRDALRSILEGEGFTVREDDDYLPDALWLVDGDTAGPMGAEAS